MVSALNRQPRGGSSRGKRLWEPVLLPLPCRLPGRKAPPQAAGHAPTKPSSDRCEQVVPLARAGGCFTAPGGDPAPGPPAIVAAIGSLRRSAFESRAMGRVCAALPPLLPPRLPPPHVQPPPPTLGPFIACAQFCSWRAAVSGARAVVGWIACHFPWGAAVLGSGGQLNCPGGQAHTSHMLGLLPST